MKKSLSGNRYRRYTNPATHESWADREEKGMGTRQPKVPQSPNTVLATCETVITGSAICAVKHYPSGWISGTCLMPGEHSDITLITPGSSSLFPLLSVIHTDPGCATTQIMHDKIECGHAHGGVHAPWECARSAVRHGCMQARWSRYMAWCRTRRYVWLMPHPCQLTPLAQQSSTRARHRA